MKQAGWLMIAIAAVVIFYNAVIVRNQNERIASEHPWQTLFSGGENLKKGYTFAPPYSGFEIFIFAIGIGGVVLAFIGHQQEQKAAEEQRRREEEKERSTSNVA
jgi:hypothetical protein